MKGLGDLLVPSDQRPSVTISSSGSSRQQQSVRPRGKSVSLDSSSSSNPPFASNPSPGAPSSGSKSCSSISSSIAIVVQRGSPSSSALARSFAMAEQGENKAGGISWPSFPLSRSSSPPGNPSLRSLARMHLADWVTLVLLIATFLALMAVAPVNRMITAEDLRVLDKPLYPSSVPAYAVPLISLGVPIFCFALSFFLRRDLCDLHQSVLGLLFAVALTAVITDALKPSVGRPRPDFRIRCFPDGVPSFSADGNVACTGVPLVVEEGRRSFPSGHSSWTFAGLGFLSLYAAGKLQTLVPGVEDLWRLLPPLVPLGGAVAVGITRIDDYWHFFTDVLAGAIIGLLAAALCYFRLYPILTDAHCSHPCISRTLLSVARNEEPERASLVDDEGIA